MPKFMRRPGRAKDGWVDGQDAGGLNKGNLRLDGGGYSKTKNTSANEADVG